MKIIQIFIFFLSIVQLRGQSDSLTKTQKRLFGALNITHPLDSFINAKTSRSQILGTWALDTINSKRIIANKSYTVKSIHSQYKVKEIEILADKKIISSDYTREVFYWSINTDTLILWRQKPNRYLKRDGAFLVKKLSQDELILTTPIQSTTLIFRRKK